MPKVYQIEKNFLLIVFKLLFLSIQGFAQTNKSFPPIVSLSSDQWKQDLHSLYDSLHLHHLNLFHYTSEKEFQKKVKQIEVEIPKLSHHEIFLRFKQLVSLTGDGHTFIVEPDTYKRYPLRFFVFEDGVRLISCDESYKDVLGMKLVSIDGHAIKEIRDSLNTIIAQDEASINKLKDQMFQITTAEHLKAFHFVKSLDSAQFTFTNGKTIRTLYVSAFDRQKKINWVWAFKKMPLFLNFADECNNSICHQPINSNTYYINFLGYPSWEDITHIAQNIYDTMSSKKGLNKVIIDMRLNGGGNFDKGLKVMLPMFLNFNALHPNVRYYVIIGRETFSAGMSNAVHFRDCLDAQVVGEPTGAKPNGYQENKWFRLPQSQLLISCSQLFYSFQKKNSDGMQPHKLIKPSFASYMKGKDPAIEWILAD